MKFEKLQEAVTEYFYSSGPIAFIAPKPIDDIVRALESGMQRLSAGAENPTQPGAFPHIQHQQLRLYDSIECKSVVRHVTIININTSKRILPVMKPMVALTMRANPRTEHSVGIIEPICYDLGSKAGGKASCA